jgi:hypothetical protein
MRFSDSVLGRHIVITTVDSGSFKPSDTDRARGWSDAGDLAYSPRIQSMINLPENSYGRKCSGFDEWYIFQEPPRRLGEVSIENVFTAQIVPGTVFRFINFGGFRPSDPRMESITHLFWRQVEWMQPESYVGDGQQCLVFASRNQKLFESIRDTLDAHPVT